MIGIDVGITNTDLVVVERGKIKSSLGSPSGKGVARRLLGLIPDSMGKTIAITGAGARGEMKSLKGNAMSVGEIESIGLGASTLAKLSKCVVASMGTGTAIVRVDGKKCFHVGGTGVGGGTIVGLGEKMLGIKEAEKIGNLALKGKLERVNITVGNVYGGGVGIVPPDATASNMAKANKCSKEDLALGILDLVGETAGVLACFAARDAGVKEIVFVGAVPTIPGMRDILERTTCMFGFKAIIPEEARFSTAFGAAMLAERVHR
ncbi:MAG: hypothetical protein ABIF01_03620 [Candidatus Micrarchaeota archaeon]